MEPALNLPEDNGAAAPSELLPPELLPDSLVREIRRSVQGWFVGNARQLPWREGYQPYQIWISEMMLQQTQVETMLPYFQRWMEKFPDVTAVARAREEAVLKAWQGLGYYARARNLHGAARAMRDNHGGHLPDTLEALLALPGIGPYSAGAILSIGHGKPAPIVDGNVARVLGRLFGLAHPAGSSAGKSALWRWAGALSVKASPALGAPSSPRDFNQGLMELGALICKRGNPPCAECPLSPRCVAHRRGAPHLYPPRMPKKPRPTRTGALFRLTRGSRVLLRKRASSGLWGGLWELPWEEAPLGKEAKPSLSSLSVAFSRLGKHMGEAAVAAAAVAPAAVAAAYIENLSPFGWLEHGLTHFHLSLACYHGNLDDMDPGGACFRKSVDHIPDFNPEEPLEGEALRWVEAVHMTELPLTTPAVKALALLESHRPSL